MINWTFVVVVSAIVAVIVELVKKLPFLAKEWSSDDLRDMTIMLLAFGLSTVLATFIGISLEICSTVAQGISYSVIVWCTQKVVGQEVIHKTLKKRVEKS